MASNGDVKEGAYFLALLALDIIIIIIWRIFSPVDSVVRID